MSLALWLAKNMPALTGRARDISMKRQDAIRRVRHALKSDAPPLATNGATMKVLDGGEGYVVKTPKQPRHPDDKTETLRRAYLKSLLSEQGLAPETAAVFTKKRRYLVQPRLKRTAEPGDYDYLNRELRTSGFYPGDLHQSNIRRTTKKPLVIDSGQFEYPDTAWRWGEDVMPVQTQADRLKARELIIRKGGKKPWLDEE